MDISVIIPYYNRDAVFAETLESVQSQSLPPREIIVVDDGSEPASGKYLSQFNSIRVIRLDRNRGAGAARNVGARAAACPLIAFQDSDDIWEPLKLEVQHSYLMENPECVGVHAGAKTRYKNGMEKVWLRKPEYITLLDALPTNCILLQTLLMRKEVFLSLGGFEENLPACSDHEFSIRLTSEGLKLRYLPDVVVTVRRDGHEHIEGSWRRYVTGELLILDKYKRLYREHLGREALRQCRGMYLRRAGQRHGKIVGRLLFAWGTLLGGFSRPGYIED